MPKKFVGESTKAVAAKEKKLKAKNEQNTKKEQERNTQEWLDTSKVVQKKIVRRQEKEEKRQQILNKKNELKDLLKQETQITDKYKSAKLTRQEIEKKVQMAKAQQNSIKKNDTHLTASLTENLNRLTLDDEIARTIDAAISLFNDDRPTQDKHPEKRLKAGHKAFEEKRLKELKVIHPTLKLSQLKAMVLKEWQKMQQK